MGLSAEGAIVKIRETANITIVYKGKSIFWDNYNSGCSEWNIDQRVYSEIRNYHKKKPFMFITSDAEL